MTDKDHENKEPMIGVTFYRRNIDAGTVTDFDGKLYSECTERQ